MELYDKARRFGMSVYAVSDLHGHHDVFNKGLEQMRLVTQKISTKS